MTLGDMIPQDVKIRRYGSGDEHRIIRLFEEVYGHTRTLAHWTWKFSGNLLKRAPIWVAENDGGELVAHYALCPVPVMLGNKQVMGAQSLDTMISRDHQRKGLMIRLASKCYQDAVDMGIELIYGYPNERSLLPLVKGLGFTSLGPIKCYELIFGSISSLPPCPSVRNSKLALRLTEGFDRVFFPAYGDSNSDTMNNDTIERVREFDAIHGSLWEKSRAGRFSVCRSPDYLNWRYSRFPDYDYLSLSVKGGDGSRGFAVIATKYTVGYIAELTPFEEDTATELLAYAIAQLKKRGVGKLVGYFLPNDREREVLKDIGFVERTSELIFCIKYLGADPPAGFTSREAWAVSFGDTDGI